MTDPGLPQTDRELVRVLRVALIVGAVCGAGIVASIAAIVWGLSR